MLTAEELRSFLRYDPDTGDFTWANPLRFSKVKPGDKAGCLGPDGYWVISIRKKPMKAHRLAWLYVYGEWPSIKLDHINRNKSDNRIKNLRLATYAENAANRSSWNRFGLKGVYKNWRCKTKPYRSCIEIRVNGKRVFKSLGTFRTKEEAHAAYINAAKKIHPEFASP